MDALLTKSCPSRFAGLVSLAVRQSLQSSFNGQCLRFHYPRWASTRQNFQASRLIAVMVKLTIQFILGLMNIQFQM
uniref:Photosystem II reaction center Psb28 protein n=1 Tax=Rhizophora mucronata TaxID=61149 RepID=A0A2P2IUP0_RHIMU